MREREREAEWGSGSTDSGLGSKYNSETDSNKSDIVNLSFGSAPA